MKLTRYIVLHILGLSAIVGLALVAIFTFIGFVSDMDDTGTGGFGVTQLIVYTALMMPAGLYTLMPLIAMLGTLLGLGTLASQSELTAMRAAGYSLPRLGGATLLAGAVLGALCLLLGDWLAPAGTQAATAYRSQARSGVEAGLGGKAIWLRDGDSLFHIQRLLAEDHIAEVEIFTLAPDHSLRETLQVAEGRYQQGEWHLSGVRRTQLSGQGAQAQQLAELRWQGSLSPEVLRLFVLEAKSLSMPGLWRLIQYLQANGLDSAQYQLSLWRKLIAPLTVMAMMLFAVPFVLGALRDAGAGQRLLVGILIGVGFYVANEVTASLGSLFAWPPFLAAALPTVVLAGLGGWRLARVR